MSFLRDLINPPPPNGKIEDYYKFFNNVNDSINALIFVSNPSVLLNSSFAVLSAKGLAPTTPADGDGEIFIGSWTVFGAANANYIIQPTVYPSNSTIQTSSDYFVGLTTTSANGDPFYFYQRQPGTVQQYQRNYLTFTLKANNNADTAIKISTAIFTFYDPSSNLSQGGEFFLPPGASYLSCQIPLTQSLDGKTVGPGNYTEFRVNFDEIPDGIADVDFYQIKCEFGKISTPLY